MSSYHVRVFGQDNKKPVFVFSDTGSVSLPSLLLSLILQSYGYKVLLYRYSNTLFSNELPTIKKTCEEINGDVLKRIAAFGKREQKYITVFGLGLGNIFSFMISNDSPAVKKMIAMTPLSDMTRVVHPKKNKRNLQEEWFDLHPRNNLDRLTGKKILIYTAKKDTFISFKEQQQLVDLLRSEGIEHQLIVNIRHSHLISTLIAVLKMDTYLRFLQEK